MITCVSKTYCEQAIGQNNALTESNKNDVLEMRIL